MQSEMTTSNASAQARSAPVAEPRKEMSAAKDPAGTDPDDPGFSARIRARDPAALQAVVRAYLPQIVRAAHGAGFIGQEAEDVAQDTFTTFIESASRFEGRSHVRTWLFGILYRKIAERRRHLDRDRHMDAIDEVVESRFDAAGSWSQPPKSADAMLDSREILEQIESCLDASPTRHRMAFVLREVEGLSTGEICKILDVSVTNLGVMLHRVRNRLRECLEANDVWREVR